MYCSLLLCFQNLFHDFLNLLFLYDFLIASSLNSNIASMFVNLRSQAVASGTETTIDYPTGWDNTNSVCVSCYVGTPSGSNYNDVSCICASDGIKVTQTTGTARYIFVTLLKSHF